MGNLRRLGLCCLVLALPLAAAAGEHGGRISDRIDDPIDPGHGARSVAAPAPPAAQPHASSEGRGVMAFALQGTGAYAAPAAPPPAAAALGFAGVLALVVQRLITLVRHRQRYRARRPVRPEVATGSAWTTGCAASPADARAARPA